MGFAIFDFRFAIEERSALSRRLWFLCDLREILCDLCG